MDILVSGGTGFIGGRLVKELVKNGHNVTCLVRKTSNTKSLEKLNVRLVVSDITDPEALDKVFERIDPDVVYHCAACVIERNEDTFEKPNINGTENICRTSLKNGVDRFIYLSSVSVISGNPESPLTEELPYKASNAYGVSKIEAEKIVVDYRNKGLKSAIIRPCMVIGENEPHAMDKLLRWVKLRRVLVLEIPEIDSSLHLVYVGNVVQLLMLALEKEEALKGTFMVADKEPVTVRKFMEILYDEYNGSRPPVVPRALMKILMIVPPVRKKIKRFFKERVYDISRATDILGYDPKISTEEGLRKTVKYWKEVKHSGEGYKSEGWIDTDDFV